MKVSAGSGVRLWRLAALRSAFRTMVVAVGEDRAMLHHYDAKHAPERAAGDGGGFARDVVTRVGFQMLVAYRLMRFFVDAGVPLAPQVASRMIRHLYGSDIHWEAQLEPGVVLVHGMGLALSSAARVQRGAILFQHVTLGLSFDQATRQTGAPLVERDVHVGAGSTLVGPITIGARSKITANCFVRTSVPPDSLVEAPAPAVTARAPRARIAPTPAALAHDGLSAPVVSPGGTGDPE
jgi:serine O-acetyltransferase